MAVHVVLFEPQIPPNTGNIARLCAAMKTPLHLIEPIGFDMSDKNLKRAGLDYWPYVDIRVHPSWDAFVTSVLLNKIWLITKFGENDLYDIEININDALVFGSEVTGLPDSLHKQFPQTRVRVTMKEEAVRCINLSTTVGIVLGEALRQLR